MVCHNHYWLCCHNKLLLSKIWFTTDCWFNAYLTLSLGSFHIIKFSVEIDVRFFFVLYIWQYQNKTATDYIISQIPQWTWSHVPQYTIQNRKVHISVPNGSLWDMVEGHCWIFKIGLLRVFMLPLLTFRLKSSRLRKFQERHTNDNSSPYIYLDLTAGKFYYNPSIIWCDKYQMFF